MKDLKIQLLLWRMACLVALVHYSSEAQVIAQTTIEEYTYLSNEIDISQSDAIVAKDGYHFGPVRVFKGVTQGLEFMCVSKYVILYRHGTWKPAAMLIMLKTTQNGKAVHLCIPLVSSDQVLHVRAFEDYHSKTTGWPDLHRQLFLDMATAMIQEIEECHKDD